MLHPLSHLHTNPLIGNHMEAVELQAIAKDFPNLMKFTATSGMLDLCITDALMQKMTHVEDIITRPSSIQFADGASGISFSVCRCDTTTSPSCCLYPNYWYTLHPSCPYLQRLGLQLLKELRRLHLLKELHNQWLPLKGHGHRHWSALSQVKSIGRNRLARRFAATSNPSLAQSHASDPLDKEAPSRNQAEQKIRFPWAAKMNPNPRNLFRATTPVYMDDGTPKVEHLEETED